VSARQRYRKTIFFILIYFLFETRKSTDESHTLHQMTHLQAADNCNGEGGARDTIKNTKTACNGSTTLKQKTVQQSAIINSRNACKEGSHHIIFNCFLIARTSWLTTMVPKLEAGTGESFWMKGSSN
jgi:hypothetical protein